MTEFSLGILETGRPPAELVPAHGTCPDMFERLLAPAGPSVRFVTYRVFEDHFPASVTACDAWLVTGSRSSVLDPDPWIPRCQAFLAGAYREGVAIVGICFGHQILAAALGGRVERSGKGWGIGIHDYSVLEAARWMPDGIARFSIAAMHEDQVVALPRRAEAIAGSPFCPNALVTYGETAISFQGHPEFTASYAHDLITLRRGKIFPAPQADKALATLDRRTDSDHVALWIMSFFKLTLSQGAGPPHKSASSAESGGILPVGNRDNS